MDSSDTRDLDYKTRDWKYTQPLQKAAFQTPKKNSSQCV
ncbi:hypothetical protein KLMA_10423 [Kluyveromyces marxianus DMKU3-1042]|uniref:Uncharacterized protein n=1 Tax=Kluyveromyces marxianus (strain DMKU3-1042 / BCC 29191 / NBRC 104275) TaxID=1003335 RepID=W0T3R7_KLUMD|nr:hypothetical protein KLMA_10423 [Kluyveromyces marxianus DMKU3-1042]BAO38045.1 hypothetical protein KLMA_10423 [Kluyveromyces marxianus DMKU3-1042]